MNHSLEANIANTMNEKSRSSSAIVGITAIIGGVSLVAVALVAIFSPQNLTVTPWIIGGLSTMGIALGYLSIDKKRG